MLTAVRGHPADDRILQSNLSADPWRRAHAIGHARAAMRDPLVVVVVPPASLPGRHGRSLMMRINGVEILIFE